MDWETMRPPSLAKARCSVLSLGTRKPTRAGSTSAFGPETRMITGFFPCARRSSQEVVLRMRAILSFPLQLQPVPAEVIGDPLDRLLHLGLLAPTGLERADQLWPERLEP